MFCPKCGTNVPEGSKFCESCGYNMQQAEQGVYQVSPQEMPKPTYNPNPAPAYQPQPRPQPAPAYQNNTVHIVDPRDKPYGIGGWLWTVLLAGIPILGIIPLAVWAFGRNTNKSKKNWAIIMFILKALVIILLAILIIYLYNKCWPSVRDFFNQLDGFEDFMG
ncbi:MAG: zinc ribbon domain-containing protein [Eubacteriales bacterium]|mgnify:CR=1 FL=1|jgi:predicted nucleic acid-binding Zn ribbon protein|nr:zinc ribbon domain-containing protein [Eubacteriales bacterium]